MEQINHESDPNCDCHACAIAERNHLRACLKKVNEQAERFEIDSALLQDEMEKLRAAAARYAWIRRNAESGSYEAAATDEGGGRFWVRMVSWGFEVAAPYNTTFDDAVSIGMATSAVHRNATAVAERG